MEGTDVTKKKYLELIFAQNSDRQYNHPYAPGGAGKTKANSCSLSQPGGFDDDDIIHLRLTGNESEGKLPLSTGNILDNDDGSEPGWEDTQARSPVSLNQLVTYIRMLGKCVIG